MSQQIASRYVWPPVVVPPMSEREQRENYLRQRAIAFPQERRVVEPPPPPSPPTPVPVEHNPPVKRDILRVASMRHAPSSQNIMPIAPGEWSLKGLMVIAGEAANLPLVDMLSERRQVDLVRARHVFFWLAKRFSRKSFPEMGRRLGGRDHTTAMHGYRRVAAIVDLMGPPSDVEDPRAWARHLLSQHWPRPPKSDASVRRLQRHWPA